MLKQKNKRKEGGITLIALVVTIIVLIILAGVSISMIVGDNGIITQAENAKKETQKAEVKEKAQIDILEKQLEKEGNITKGDFVEILKEYFDNVPTEENLPEDLSTVTLPSKEEYGGHEINIGEIWNGTFVKTVEELEAGDYIKYHSGTNGEIICRVLYPGNSEYGVQIISDKNVKAVTLGGSTFEEGKVSYNGAIEKLNDEAEKYINSAYATDARCVGSVPTVENGVFINKDSETVGPVTMQFPYNGSTSVDCKNTDTNYTTDESQLKSFNLWITGESYWLTSRDVASTDSNCAFCMRLVNNDGTIYDDGLCLVEKTGNAIGYLSERGLRLCILLKSNVKITGGDGSEETPYTIN